MKLHGCFLSSQGRPLGHRSALLGALLVGGLFSGLLGEATAQSFYGVDGAGGLVEQRVGPPWVPCGYPNGPGNDTLSFTDAGLCGSVPTFAGPPGGLLGDVAVDRKNDRIYMTDGTTIGCFTPAGTQLNLMHSGSLGLGPLTGLAFDSDAELLWVSDGAEIGLAFPSLMGSCSPPGLAWSFPATGLGFVTDVAWHPSTARVYALDSDGNVAAYDAFGATEVSPYPAAGLANCLIPAPFTGLAVDMATGCEGGDPALFLTNGFGVSYEHSGGVPAGFEFYAPLNCFVWPGQPTQGLDFAARPITFGTSTGPQIGTSGGQSVLPNPAFTVTLTGGPRNGQAYLIYGVGAACPALNYKGNPWYVDPSFTPIGPLAVSPSGTLTLPLALPTPGGSLPCGTTIFMQWVCKAPGGGGAWTTSQGLEFTTAMP
ncbi:MAG: hypothetical protein ACT4PU_05750 [Planctomycetota bacterium]